MKLKKIVGRKFTIAALTLTLASSFVGRKAYIYSADPTGEKECPPLNPSLADSASDSTTAQVNTTGLTLPWAQKGGTLNDASCLNQTAVYGVVQVTEVEDIQEAILLAKEHGLPLSIAGVKHSMGGQAFFKNAIVLDMTPFNKMSLDEESKTLTVQSGATWHDIQDFLHPRFAVKAMQSTDIFTVGGSISVNAHGMDHHIGALGNTIRSMRVMLPDGSIQSVSRSEKRELFDLVVGGYGLFGIILDAELEITDNVLYERERSLINYKEFPDFFTNELADEAKYGLFYGHLSTAPDTFLQEMLLYTYRKTDDTAEVEIPPLTEVENVKLRRLIFNLSKQGPRWMSFKWWAEKNLEPRLEACFVNRNQAMKEGEACLIARNQPMHDSVKYSKNSLTGETDILQEYFIPRSQFIPFVDEARLILQEHNTNLVNASVRVVHKEDIALTYAPTEMFSLVLYINQSTDSEGNAKMQQLTSDLIDLTIAHGGRFFLPYQLYFTEQQLEQSYPEIRSFFAAKQQYDPNLLLTNTFYEKYAKGLGATP